MFTRFLSSAIGSFARATLPMHAVGLVPAALFFAAALTPSLIPRAGMLQGVLAGAAFAVGYGLGVLGLTIWRFLGLREIPLRWQPAVTRVVLVVGILLMLAALWQAAAFQALLHEAMGLPAVETIRPFVVALTALAVAVLFVLLGRAFRALGLVLSRRLRYVMPERVALITGFVAAVFLFNFIGNDLILSRAVGAFDATYQALDSALADDAEAPSDPFRTGSAASLIGWEGIGAEGRNRVLDPLNADQIADIAGSPAQEPLRIYVGLGSADTPVARAELALAEAIRTRAFDRGTLVIATPTGTGWIDPAGVFPLEVLTRGDVATVSVQYSYLPSWLSLLTVPEYGAETARAVFAAIHGHWRTLPADNRPDLYLFGLSLGALNSDLSADFYDLVAAPYQGAFWVGPPFATPSWRRITADRQPGSPAWLPQFRDGSSVRFLNQFESPADDVQWGPMRIVILQYASDPITFFDPAIIWRRPDWMADPRGPDVIREFGWFPVVTFLQTGFDLLTATTAPRGFGHVYAGRDYLRGWVALLSPPGWDAEGLARIEAAMTARGL